MHKKIIKFLLIFFLFLIILKILIFKFFVEYEPFEQRIQFVLSDTFIIKEIDKKAEHYEKIDLDKILKITNKITSRSLNFSKTSDNYNPDYLYIAKKTNCIGYATFYCSVCNYLLIKYGYSDEWKANAYVGYIYFFGFNIHRLFNNPFFKNHDFVVIENTKTGEKILTDPSLYDYFYVHSVNQK